MLSATLTSGLSGYGIGAKVRALRLKKKMGLVELGRHTGLSPALLSKIERSRLFPTLPTLLRIALVFSVGLEFFFAGAREKPLVAVVRKAQRVRLPERAGERQPRTDSSRSTSPHRSAASTPTLPSSLHRDGRRAAAHASGRRAHLRAARYAFPADRGRRAHPGYRRLDLFRLERRAHLSPWQRAPLHGDRRDLILRSRQVLCATNRRCALMPSSEGSASKVRAIRSRSSRRLGSASRAFTSASNQPGPSRPKIPSTARPAASASARRSSGR